MNNWLVFALLSPLVYAVVNFIDKYLIEKKVKDCRGMRIYATIMWGVVGTLFWIITGLKLPPLHHPPLVLLSGIFQIVCTSLSKLSFFPRLFPIFAGISLGFILNLLYLLTFKKILVRRHLLINYYLERPFVWVRGLSTNDFLVYMFPRLYDPTEYYEEQSQKNYQTRISSF